MSTNSTESGILFGGPGSERKVSVATSQHVARVSPGTRCFFWAPDDSIAEVPVDELLGFQRPFENDFAKPVNGPHWTTLVDFLDDYAQRSAVLFLGLHGDMSENGGLQRCLEDRQIAYTGSDSVASQLAFDKARAKERVARGGLSVSPAITITGENIEAAHAAFERMNADTQKVVLKPVADGSSTGMFIIDGKESRLEAFDWLRANPKQPHMVERFVEGKELTVGVIDRPDGRQVLPCTEVRLEQGRSFDFAGKYLGDGSLEITPAEVSDEVTQAAQEMALRAHEILNCFGYSRTDMIIDEAGPVFIETNTLPGLTPASFLPQQLEVEGISMETFIAEQITLAMGRNV